MIKILLVLLLLSTNSWATSLIIPYQNEQPGGTIKSGDWNSNMQAIAQWANNNNIDGSTNIATAGVTTSSIANGAVTNAKIDNTAGIFTYGDVYGSALISLPSIASSAGEIPTANLAGTGTASGNTFLRGDQTWNNATTLYSYGSSTTGSTIINAVLKVAYGSFSYTSGNVNVTGLPFTSSSSYSVTCVNGDLTPANTYSCETVSGSEFTVQATSSTHTVNWIAVGT